MHPILSIFVASLVLYLFFTNKHKAIAFIFIFTLFNGDFQFNVGASVNVYHFITFLYFPKLVLFLKKNMILRGITRPLRYELIIICIFGVIFGFIYPFDDPFSMYRTFTQQASMRAIISFSRIFLEFFSILLIVYWLVIAEIKLSLLIKYFSIVTIISVILAIILFFFPSLFRPLFPNFEHHFIGTRFTGLVGEPRTFGRFCAFALIFLLFYFKYGNKQIAKLAVLMSSFGVLISLSASAIIVTVVGLSVYFVLLRRKLFSLILVFFVGAIGYWFLQSNEFFMNTTMSKIQFVVSLEQDNIIEKRINEPDIFTRFEIFDRAALNFMYNNPIYFIFGVGPNLVSIPASQYLPPEFVNSEVYGNGINSVPSTLLVNILARSGFVGLLLQMMFFVVLTKKLNLSNERNCFITIFIMSMITASNLYFLIVGVSISVVLLQNRHKVIS